MYIIPVPNYINTNIGYFLIGCGMKKHIVYEIIFTERKLNNISPHSYIGSKSNAEMLNGKIIDKHGHIYKSSSTCPYFWEAIENEDYECVLLYSTDDFKDMLSMENYIQKERDVVRDINYFNKSYAAESFYASPDHVTVYDTIDKTHLRIHKDVFYLEDNNRYVGTTHGTSVYNDGVRLYYLREDDELIDELKLERGIGNAKIRQTGKLNPFYGKHHTEETKEKIRTSQKKWKENNKERYNELREIWSKNFKEIGSKPKSKEFKQMVSDRHKGTLYIKHIDTGECLEVTTDDYYKIYNDTGVWLTLNMYSKLFSEPRLSTCPYCGYEGDLRNSSFLRWHFEKCDKKPGTHSRYSPWTKCEKGNESYELYSKYDLLYDMFHSPEYNNISAKSKYDIIRKEFNIDKSNMAVYYCFKRMLGQISKGYNPREERLWIDEFQQGDVNE